MQVLQTIAQVFELFKMPCLVTLLQLGNDDDDADAGCNQGASAHAQENIRPAMKRQFDSWGGFSDL
jgi:hypothetical protein